LRATTHSELCGGKPCWRAADTNAFKYKDAKQNTGLISRALLKSGSTGKARVQVLAKGPMLETPALPLALPVRVQLQAENGECWEARYFELGTLRNDTSRFKAEAFTPEAP